MIIKKLVLVVFVVFISLLLFLIISTNNKKTERKNLIEELPEFSAEDIKGEVFNVQSLYEDYYYLFIKADQECGFCTHLLNDIKNNLALFDNLQIIINYTDTNKVEFVGIPAATIICGEIVGFNKFWESKSRPHMMLYAPSKRLVWEHSGALSSKKILEVIHDYSYKE
jgi:thioredoxin-related protein